TIQYNKLPAGNYTLHIKAGNSRGSLAPNELIYDIAVLEYYYETTWFKGLIFFGLLGIVIYILHSRNMRKLKEERLRTKLSSDLHDEVSGLLSTVASSTDVLLMQEVGDKKLIKKIGEQARIAMQQMSDVLWSIDARKDTFDDLVLRIKNHA